MECPICGSDSYDHVFGNCLDCEEINTLPGIHVRELDWEIQLEETATINSTTTEMDNISERSLDRRSQRLDLKSSNS